MPTAPSQALQTYTHELLQTLQLSEEDLRANQQDHLSPTQRARIYAEDHQLTWFFGVILIALIAFSSILASELSAQYFFHFIALIGLTLVVGYATFKLALSAHTLRHTSAEQLRVEMREAPITITVVQTRSRGLSMRLVATVQGKPARLPHHVLLHMANGLRYKPYTYKGSVMAVEAVELPTSAQRQQAPTMHQERQAKEYRFVILMLLLAVGLLLFMRLLVWVGERP